MIAVIKEMEILKNGERVTPMMLTDSVRMQDGSKLIEAINKMARNLIPVAWKAMLQKVLTVAITSVCYGDGKFVVGD